MIGTGIKAVSFSLTKPLITKNQQLNIAKKPYSTLINKAYSNDTHIHHLPFEISRLYSTSNKINSLNADNNIWKNFTEKTEISLEKNSLFLSIPFKNEKYLFNFYYPKPPVLNTFTKKVETSLISFVETFGLYKGYSNTQAVENGKFAHLKGSLYPKMREKELKVNAFYTTILFDNDDRMDDNQKFIDSLEDVSRFNDKMIKACTNTIDENVDVAFPRVKALQYLYQEYFHEYKCHLEKDYDVFIDSLGLYLRSTLVEKFFENSEKNNFDINGYLSNRRHSGGCLNILYLAFLTESISFHEQVKKYPVLQYMLEDVVDIVGITNDIYSSKKEFKELEKKTKEKGEDINNEECLKKYLKNNLVFLLWKNQLSDPEGFIKSIRTADIMYNEKLISYYNWRETIKDFVEKDSELAKTVELIDGWNSGHISWAIKYSAKRYEIDQA